MVRKSAIILLVSLILAVSCVTTERAGELTLSGQGTVSAPPDRVSFDLTFRETGQTTTEAREKVNGKANRAVDILTGSGIAGDDIRTTGIDYRRRTRWNDGEEIFLGQEAVQTLQVAADLDDKVSRLNVLIDKLTEIDGLGMGGLSFTVSRSSIYREEARSLAFEDARERAEHYALLAGRSLGKVLSLAEKSTPLVRESYMMLNNAEADRGSTEVQAGLNEITVVIEVVFALE